MALFLKPKCWICFGNVGKRFLKTKHEQVVRSRQADAERAVTHLMQNVPPVLHGARRHIVNVLVNDEPGVLSRISGVLAGRGINISSLAVSSTEVQELSRVTVVLNGNAAHIEQVRRQLEDVPQVWTAVYFPPGTPIIERELCLVKVATTEDKSNTTLLQKINGIPGLESIIDNATPLHDQSSLLTVSATRHALNELTKLFNGRVVEVKPQYIAIEIVAKSVRVDEFIDLIRPFGIIELARTGTIAMARGSVTNDEYKTASSSDDRAKSARLKPKGPMVDDTQLPPG